MCAGCGARLPRITPDPGSSARSSAECAALAAELGGFEFERPDAYLAHQMTVDAWGAQHAGSPTKPIRVVYSLVGLHLAVDRGCSGREVQHAHQRMGKPQADWPRFDEPPERSDWPTVVDVAGAGLRIDSVPGHLTAVRDWGAAVWSAWAPRHDDVRALAERLLPRLP